MKTEQQKEIIASLSKDAVLTMTTEGLQYRNVYNTVTVTNTERGWTIIFTYNCLAVEQSAAKW